MKVKDVVALVTGAGSSRGIGKAFVQELCHRGAARVYATDISLEGAQRLAEMDPAGRIIPLRLDVTIPSQVSAAAAKCRDVLLLINNAGVCYPVQLIGAADLSSARREMEVNMWGMLEMCRAFAPALKANGGGAIVNISSVYGLVNYPYVGSYSVSKAANMSMTQGVRAELSLQGTHVVAVYPGTIDTDLSATNPYPNKTAPASLARLVLDGLEQGAEDIFVGDDALDVRDRLARDPKAVERDYAAKLRERLHRA